MINEMNTVDNQDVKLAVISSSHEYVAGGTVGTHTDRIEYFKRGNDYFVRESEYDDFRDTDYPYEYKVTYDDILQKVKENMGHETKYRNIYSGTCDAICDDARNVTIYDDKLRADIDKLQGDTHEL